METVVIGEITGVYGVKGWLRLRSWTQPLEQVFSYQPWLLVDQGGEQGAAPRQAPQLLTQRAHGGHFVISLEGVTDRDQAAQLVGQQVHVARDRLPELPEDEYYWAELVGMQVSNLAGCEFGKVSDLLETGANDVLVIEGERQRLVPFVQGQTVTSIDRSAGRIVVDWDSDF